MTIVSLTSDLGLADYYVGAVKGKLLGLLPEVSIVDISHQNSQHIQVDRKFDRQHAAYSVKFAFPHFPKGSIHLIGVSFEARNRFLMVKYKEQYFVGPDNGIFSILLDEPANAEVYDLDTSKFNAEALNFPLLHIFVPTAVALAKGSSLDKLGQKRNVPIQQSAMQPYLTENKISCTIVSVDDFENLITDLKKEVFVSHAKGRNYTISFRGNETPFISESYEDPRIEQGSMYVLFNSAGYLEIALKHANASGLLGLRRGDRVNIEFE